MLFYSENGYAFTSSGEPEATQIVLSDEEHSFELNEKALESILLRDDIKDLPIAIVSVAGAFRKGKSFLLDFFIRYLTAGVSSFDLQFCESAIIMRINQSVYLCIFLGKR